MICNSTTKKHLFLSLIGEQGDLEDEAHYSLNRLEAPYSLNRLVISGFIPGGPAAKLKNTLKIGDWIRSIDGQQVENAYTFLFKG